MPLLSLLQFYGIIVSWLSFVGRLRESIKKISDLEYINLNYLFGRSRFSFRTKICLCCTNNYLFSRIIKSRLSRCCTARRSTTRLIFVITFILQSLCFNALHSSKVSQSTLNCTYLFKGGSIAQRSAMLSHLLVMHLPRLGRLSAQFWPNLLLGQFNNTLQVTVLSTGKDTFTAHY